MTLETEAQGMTAAMDHPEGFVAVYEPHYSALVRLAFGLVRDRQVAKDVTQEARRWS